MKPGQRVKSGARFHIPDRLGPGAELDLPAIAAHHAIRVLRLAEKDPLVVFDGSGGEYDATITHIARGSVRIKTGRLHDVGPESPLHVTLVQGVSGADRMDITVRKTVELGVSRIVPVLTERSVVKLGADRADRRRTHWQGIVISACEQCGRNVVPPVEEPVAFPTWLSTLERTPPASETRLFLAVDGATRMQSLPAPLGRVCLLAGPEGGFSPVEAELAASRGFVPVRLGPRVLRTETAALAALAALQTLWGDF
ncbi:MAG: 16S rRNA (uracil(1498)-N(3))-methyltransferase [Betaproteobacteria bacterium]|nr:16S rRNA (uracil(1498)-N(3))-methyltransferase [Betaproteobacteria bacterium]